MANNQNVNKVVYAGNTLIDLTSDDVTAGDVLSGKKFHLASGAEATGTMPNIGAISGILKGDGAGNVSAATAGTDYVTPAQSVALGLTGASVGDLVRVNSVDATGKPTSWKHVPLNEIKCNKNYFINHYMGGGGSQRTDKQNCLPINQRGHSTYTNVGYGLDMWRLLNGATINIANKYIELINTKTYPEGFIQIFPLGFFEEHDGEFVTISALTSYGKLYTGTIQVDSTTGYTWVRQPQSSISNDVGFQISIGKNTGNSFDHVRVCAALNSSTRIVDMKLEFSPEQTLAHNEGTEENPVWVLNEIPDYGEELRKCQRYFRRFKKYPSATSGYSTFGFGMISSATNCNIVIPTQAQMIDNPAISYSGNFRLVIGNADKPVTGISWSPGADNGVMVAATFSESSSDIGKAARLAANNDPNAYIDASCEP